MRKIFYHQKDAQEWAAGGRICSERMGIFPGRRAVGEPVLALMAYRAPYTVDVEIREAPMWWSPAERTAERLGLLPPMPEVARGRKGGLVRSPAKAAAKRGGGPGRPRLDAETRAGVHMCRQIIYLTPDARDMLRRNGRGGMSAYIERLLRADDARGRQMGAWV